MLRKQRLSSTRFSDFNTLQFAGVMGMVVFVILLVLMTISTHDFVHASADLAKVHHPVSMPGAVREDALTSQFTRDGKIYFEV